MNTHDSTTELLNKLNHTSLAEMDDYLTSTPNSGKPVTYFSEYLAAHNIPVSQLVKSCQGYISKSYIYELLNGQKSNPSRDNLLMLCLSAHMNLKDTRRTLEVYRQPSLYPKNSRDAIIGICINNQVFDIACVNDTLHNKGEALLGAE